MRGLRLALPPAAPDTSGAAGVFYALGGIVIICDAGGCAGNICGFDEPRWQSQKSAVFSAGLRDMDAILGRDDQLIAKLKSAASSVNANFAAIVGTPVPSVIGTDYHALCRMGHKETGIPVIAIPSDGTHLYDYGEEKAYLALFENFSREKNQTKKEPRPHVIGVLGVTPLNTSMMNAEYKLRTFYADKYNDIWCYGAEGGLSPIENAAMADMNLVIATSGLESAWYLKQQFGTPFRIWNPFAEEAAESLLASSILKETDDNTEQILILHQQIYACSMRTALRKKLPDAGITVGSWFQMDERLTEPQDISLREEDDLKTVADDYDIIIGDSSMQKIIPDYRGKFIDCPHFALSGRLSDGREATVQ